MSEIVAEGIIEAKALREYIDVFTPITSEGRVHWNDEGLLTNVVDPSTSAMIAPTKLSTSYFESYDAPGAVTVGVEFDHISERLKPAAPNDLVHLAVDMETRKLQMDFANASQMLRLIDTDSIRQEPDIPDLDLANWMVIEGSDLKYAVEIANLASDYLELLGKPEEKVVEVYASGDVDSSTVTFGEDEIIEASVDEESRSIYSLEFLEDLVKPMPDDAEIRIEFGTEYPIIMDWESLGGALTARSMLAPRIEK